MLRPSLSAIRAEAEEGNLVPTLKISAAVPGISLGRIKIRFRTTKKVMIDTRACRTRNFEVYLPP
jgi:hypothetical protein